MYRAWGSSQTGRSPSSLPLVPHVNSAGVPTKPQNSEHETVHDSCVRMPMQAWTYCTPMGKPSVHATGSHSGTSPCSDTFPPPPRSRAQVHTLAGPVKPSAQLARHGASPNRMPSHVSVTLSTGLGGQGFGAQTGRTPWICRLAEQLKISTGPSKPSGHCTSHEPPVPMPRQSCWKSLPIGKLSKHGKGLQSGGVPVTTSALAFASQTQRHVWMVASRSSS
mmetsp:Transcript_43956/g.133131  ORF Transcript_43956/g.133131 Transcript_43956/m.133131 type:complete len:221 (-) Transcript_43956:807-1469(-)